MLLEWLPGEAAARGKGGGGRGTGRRGFFNTFRFRQRLNRW